MEIASVRFNRFGKSEPLPRRSRCGNGLRKHMAFPVRPVSRASSVWERVGVVWGGLWDIVSFRAEVTQMTQIIIVPCAMDRFTITTSEKIVDNCGDQHRSLWGEQVELKLVTRHKKTPQQTPELVKR